VDESIVGGGPLDAPDKMILPEEFSGISPSEPGERRRLLSCWPYHPTLFLLLDFNTPNSITILTFPFSNPLTKSHNKKTNTNMIMITMYKLVTLVPTIYSHPDPL
jgi:hypothetical protein